ncbi:hypothetical protein GCM10009872_55150 [Actinopolymorpha rutila]
MMWKEAVRRTYNAGLAMGESVLRPAALSDVLFLVGSGRSGTTALMEALIAGLGAQPIFEPLHPRMSPVANPIVPVHGYPRISPTEDAPAMRALMGGLFEGRHLSKWTTAQTSFRDLRQTKRLVVKEVRAARMLGWVENQFPDVAVRYMVRHPAAVVSSMLKADWGSWPWAHVVPPAAAALGVDADDVAPRSSPPSRWLTLLWIADNALATRELADETLRTTVYYEELVTEPERALAAAAAAYPHFDLGRAVRSLDRPSQMASPEYGHKKRDHRIPAPERRDMSSMLRDFGVDIYAMEEPLPTRRLGL